MATGYAGVQNPLFFRRTRDALRRRQGAGRGHHQARAGNVSLSNVPEGRRVEVCGFVGSAAPGLVVSVVGLGTNNLGIRLEVTSRGVARWVHAAIGRRASRCSIQPIRTASPRSVSARPLAGKRDNVIIATKFGSDVRRRGLDNGEDWDARGSRPLRPSRAVESSLRRLRTDWIDLYQLHYSEIR